MIKMMMTVLWEWLINDKMLTLFPAKTIEESPHHVKPQTRLEWELNFNWTRISGGYIYIYWGYLDNKPPLVFSYQ